MVDRSIACVFVVTLRSLPRVVTALFGVLCAAGALRASEVGAEWGLSTIDASGAERHLSVLASDEYRGREAGTPSNERALSYIEHEFRKYGLQPGGERGGYRQEFEAGSVRADAGSSLSFELGGRAGKATIRRDFHVLRDSPDGQGDGVLVFAGFGIEDATYNDYADLDVKGKVVLCLRETPLKGLGLEGRALRIAGAERAKAESAAKQGAVAILFIHNDRWRKPDIPADIYAMSARSGEAPLPGFHLTRGLARDLLKTARLDLDGLEQAITETGKPRGAATEIRVRFDVKMAVHKPQNVLGILRGDDLAEEYVVVGAHMDHVGLGGFASVGRAPGEIHNGADDNASGTTAMLLVARALSGAAHKARRSVLFMGFNAEEKGLLGSRAFVERPTVPRPAIKAMINLDMVGRMRDGKVEVSAVGSWELWQPLLDGVRARLPEAQDLDLNLQRELGGSNSDHWPFLSAEIPALFFFTGMHPQYHAPDDDLPLLNLDGLARIAKIVATVTWAVTNLEEAPVYTQEARDELARRRQGGGRGNRRLVGFVPGREDEAAEGVAVAEVMEGYAAQAAGIEPGDAIVELDGLKVSNTEDIAKIMAEKEIGDALTITYVRDGKRITREVKVLSGQ